MLNFTPGPSQLYFTVQDHVRKAFKEGIPSISHRSRSFENIFQQTCENLRVLLSIPADFEIYFVGSATEIFERVIQNFVEHHSTHLVNGAFSKRFFETAIQLNKKSDQIVVNSGSGFANDISIHNETELIAVTQNETSTGVSTPISFIDNLSTKYPNALIVVDAVSSLPYPTFNFDKIDSLFFSVQKGFGLPAGLGVWIVNKRCIEKAAALQSQGNSIGSYHGIKSLHEFAAKNQTPETPNVLAIYLLAGVTHNMLERGITNIRRETDYKATLLYQLLSRHALMKPFVTEKAFQSKTVIAADCGDHVHKILPILEQKGIIAGEGYGKYKANHLRFANFPTHSKEQFELLVDTLDAIN
jgi:phosphoserine aminotransferase